VRCRSPPSRGCATSGEGTFAGNNAWSPTFIINDEGSKVVRYIHDLFPTMYRQIAVHLNVELASQAKVSTPIKYGKLREKYRTTVRGAMRILGYIHQRLYWRRSMSPYQGSRSGVRSGAFAGLFLDQSLERNQEIVMMRNASMTSSVNYKSVSGNMRQPHCGNAHGGSSFPSR